MTNTTNTAHKYGLVAEGGGMKCVYGSAILDCMLDDGVTSFDYAIGSSAACANVISYLAGQNGRTKRFYTEHISDPRFYGWGSLFKTGSAFGLEYILSTLSNSDGADPLDYQAFCANPCEYEIPVTNAKTGRVEYLPASAIAQDDYRALMACCSLPGASPAVELFGNKYYDGGIADPIPLHRACEKGCDRIVCIVSRKRDFLKKRDRLWPACGILCWRYPQTTKALYGRKEIYRRDWAKMFEMEREGRVFVFSPSNLLNSHTISVDAKAEEELYELGRKDYAQQRDHFLSFMSGRDR